MKKFLLVGLILLSTLNIAAAPVIIDKPIKWTAHREKFIREYAEEQRVLSK